MTTYIYSSAFSDDADPALALTPSTGDIRTMSDGPRILTDGQPASGQGLASFICHVAFLDENLQRGDRSAFFAAHRARLVNRKLIGNGISFIVERAELEDPQGANDAAESSQTAKLKTKVVVVKTAREHQHHRNQWGEVLLEIRSLLHEPIRYHPNIVKLLDIRWDTSTDTGSPFPAIVQEYAGFGTLDKLQQRTKPLPFSIKQKLCYDIGRALSIIHACGMVHGDLKHENVLIFVNPYPNPPNQPYTAKLADFGGTVMDMSGDGTHSVPMHTFPYEAPEVGEKLTEDGAKKTDAYSYGMLIWRCMVDSHDILTSLGMSTSRGNLGDSKLRDNVKLLKLSDGLLEAAIHNVANYFFQHQLPGQSLNLVTSALMFTLRGDPNQRALDRAQVRLRGMDSVAALHYVGIKDEANRKTLESLKHQTPGQHGMDLDSVGFGLGRLGNDYDAQNNLPGFRPDLPRPTRDGFLFKPLTLRHLLDRAQQEAMVRDFESLANSPAPVERDTSGDLRPEPWSAAFFLFQTYLCGFGVPFDAEKACYWLCRAADPPEEQGETDYLALAWMNRVHAALGVPNPYDTEKQIENLFWGTIRGHRHCVEDAEAVISSSGNPGQKEAWRQKMKEAEYVYQGLTGGTGMPFFAPRKLTRSWDLIDLSVLDSQLKQELGRDYESCLRPPAGSEEASHPIPEEGYQFDKIYVNHKGHGLLHIAAIQGRLPALKHLHQKYLCDINLKNQSHGDTALICACRTGRFDIAMWLLDNGADPNGAQFCEESPLHCISFSNEHEMEAVICKLIAAGADTEKLSQASRKDVRDIIADWEDTFFMILTPLGRAVLKQSLLTVKVLLKHGARPTEKPADHKRAISAVELAAVLTLPDILEELLKHIDSTVPIFDECEMLDAARSEETTPYDPLSLHSRLIRCGTNYKASLLRTLTILHNRRKAQPNRPAHTPGKHLCNEILLGNTDIVSALLSLGHSPDGCPGHRPLVTAVQCNNHELFRLLTSHGPSLAYTSDTHQTLLHFLALRFPHTPTELTLAQYLVHSYGANDPIIPDQPSPLVLAIRNGFFALADLLVSHGAGASLNTLHTAPETGLACSLLGSLLRGQTSFSLRAIRYLAHLHRTTSTNISPLVCRSTDGVECSAVHALAMVPAGEWNSHRQISAGIVQLVLDMFPAPESLGEWSAHSLLGTAMSAAVAMGHVELVRMLLAARGYRREWNVIPRADAGGQVAELTSLGLARKKAAGELLRLDGAEEVEEAEVEGVGRMVEIVGMLEVMEAEAEAGSEDEATAEASRVAEMWKGLDFDARIVALEGRVKNDFVEPEIDREGEGVNLPADLSVMTDEMPTGWKEGCEMTSEMALRILLKTFREDNRIFGDGIVKVMSKMFNKRD
ncbi:serine/threonine protein kinase [Trichoderma longibrachiatum]